jgi:hypothetical protein
MILSLSLFVHSQLILLIALTNYGKTILDFGLAGVSREKAGQKGE